MDSLFTIAAILAVLALAAGGYYFYTRTRGDTPLFAPKVRRLAFIERAYLDGGRKLLLVRRDNVEHLILIGGPIDLVVEAGIRSEKLADGAAEEDSFADSVRPYTQAGAWPGHELNVPMNPANVPAGPTLSIPSAEEDTLELTASQEAKTVQ